MIISTKDILKLKGIITNFMAGSDELKESRVLDTDSMREALNNIFGKNKIGEVVYTRNTDKMFFGIIVMPYMPEYNLLDTIFSDIPQPVNLCKVELDSKLFNVGMEPEEIIAYLLYEISEMIMSPAPVAEVRRVLDLYQMNHDQCLGIKKCAKCTQLLSYAIKDAMIKFTSLLYKDFDAIYSNEVVKSADLDDSLISALMKVQSSVFGVGAFVNNPKLTQLEWALNVCEDMDNMCNDAIRVANEAKSFTASKLVKFELDKVIKYLYREDERFVDKIVEPDKVIKESIVMNERGGLFGRLKIDGLRGIEDDLYEFSIRVKNADTEEDAYLTLRSINNRINLLEEYLYLNPDISQAEADHWRSVCDQFRKLRIALSNKKIVNQKSYGIFVDYDQLDTLG